MPRYRSHKLEASQSLALELVDADGRTNKVPAQFVFDVLKNKPPDLKLAAPRGDQRVSPLEEMAFAAEAADDFGLRSVGLTYTMAGQEPATIKLDAQTARHEKRQFGHMVRLEDLRAVPDQLLSWFVWAEDFGPDGQLRRTESDMYFAEVRPLDEIFREGSGRRREFFGGGGDANGRADAQAGGVAEADHQCNVETAAAVPAECIIETLAGITKGRGGGARFAADRAGASRSDEGARRRSELQGFVGEGRAEDAVWRWSI